MADRTDVYFRQTAAIRARVEQTIVATWGGLPSFREADMSAWVDRVLPVVTAGQRQIATLTDAYLVSVASGEMRGAVGLDLDAVTGTALRGVAPATVYARPASTVYSALAAGRSLEQAGRQGLARAKSLAATDLQLAKTHAARASGMRRGVKFYRRRLSGAENCALCIIASTQRYSIKDLQPIHPGCDCGVAELAPHESVSQIIDQDLLDQTHDLVQSGIGTSDRAGRAPDYRKLIVTRQHGEYGPTLAWLGQKFTGPKGLAVRANTAAQPVKASAGLVRVADVQAAQVAQAAAAAERAAVAERAAAARQAARAEAAARAAQIAAEAQARAQAAQAARAAAEAENATAARVARLRAASLDDLDAQLGAAYEADAPDDVINELVAEIDRRDLLASKAEQARARRAALKEAEAQRIQALIDEGMDGYDAVEEITGVTVENQHRAEALQHLRENGYSTARSFDQAASMYYRDRVAQQMTDAEDYIRGGDFRNLEGRRRKVSENSLFFGNEATARKYASPELREYWDANGRLTLDQIKGELSTGRSANYQGQDFLQ